MADVETTTKTSRRPPRARKVAPVEQTAASMGSRILDAMAALTSKGLRKPRGKTDVVRMSALDSAVSASDVDAFRDALAALVVEGKLEELPGPAFRLPTAAPAPADDMSEAALAAAERDVIGTVGIDGEATCEEIAHELALDLATVITLVEPLIARGVLRKVRSSGEAVWYEVTGEPGERIMTQLRRAAGPLTVEQLARAAVLTEADVVQLVNGGELGLEHAVSGGQWVYSLPAPTRALPPPETTPVEDSATAYERKVAERRARGLEQGQRYLDEERVDHPVSSSQIRSYLHKLGELFSDDVYAVLEALKARPENDWGQQGHAVWFRQAVRAPGQAPEPTPPSTPVVVEPARDDSPYGQARRALAGETGSLPPGVVAEFRGNDGRSLAAPAARKPRAPRKAKGGAAAQVKAPVVPAAPAGDEDPRVRLLPIWLNSPAGHAAVPHRLAPASAVAVLPLLSPEQRSLEWLSTHRAELRAMLVAAGKTEATAATYAGNVSRAAKCRLETAQPTAREQLIEAGEAIVRWPALGRWLAPALAEATKAVKGVA